MLMLCYLTYIAESHCSNFSSKSIPVTSGEIEGERGGTVFPFRFSRGNAVPLAQMAVNHTEWTL